MYQHHLDDMADVIANKLSIVFFDLGLDKDEISDLRKHIQAALGEYWADKMALVWCVNDVLEQADELGIALSDKEAKSILDDILDHHDCEMGVSWLTLRCAIEDYPKSDDAKHEKFCKKVVRDLFSEPNQD